MEADLVAVQDWDGFDALASYLQSQHGASAIEKLDGPESRVWKFSIGNAFISLHDNPDGNYLKAVGDEAQKALQVILGDLDRRFTDSSSSEDRPASTTANQPCPGDGYWFSPAIPGGSRFFRAGEIMPEAIGHYGETIWQWSIKQS